jgi:hypothetical protein
MMRASAGTFLALVSCVGCASHRHLEIAATDTVPVPVEVHLLDPGLCQIEAVSCRCVDDEWVLSGRVVCRDSRLYTKAHRLVKIQAVRGTDEVVFSKTVLAERSPTTVHHQASRRGTFHVEIPPPDTFDFLDVALITPDQAN